MKKVISLMCALCLMLVLIHSKSEASASSIPNTPLEIAAKMNRMGIVVGEGKKPDGSIDFNLGGNMTRAEIVTTIVRAFGQEQAAKLAKAAPSFADVSGNEWYSGYVAVAKNLAAQAGNPIGRDANTFDPNASVTKAEALVFVMKYLGMKVEPSGANWYEAWIAKAVELGMISANDAATTLANPDSSATRGEAFVILDFGYSAKVLADGKSLYTSYVDSEAPQLSIDGGYPEVTTSDSVTLSGHVKDNKSAVNLTSAPVSNISVTNGSWSASFPLKDGENVIQISATDTAGNTATKSATIQRVSIKSILLSPSSISMLVNSSHQFTATVMGTHNMPITNIPVTWNASGGSIDSTGKFTSNTEGTFTITATAGNVSASATAYVSEPEPVTPPPRLYLAPIADQTYYEGVNASINVSATIPPSVSHIIFSATGLPDGLSINPATGHISGFLGYRSEGVFDVTVTLRTFNFGTISRSFKLTVVNTDTTPEWKADTDFNSSIADGSADISIDLGANFIDADRDELVFIVEQADESSSYPSFIEITEGILKMRAVEIGTYKVKVTASDNTHSVSVILTWVVN